MKKDHGGTSGSLVATVTGVGPLAGGSGGEGAESYLEAWSQGDLNAMSMLLAATPPDFDTIHELIAEQLRLDDARFQAGAPLVSGDAAVVPFAASLGLAGSGNAPVARNFFAALD